MDYLYITLVSTDEGYRWQCPINGRLKLYKTLYRADLALSKCLLENQKICFRFEDGASEALKKAYFIAIQEISGSQNLELDGFVY